MANSNSDIASRTFSVEGIDQRLIFGQADSFLRIIESRFDARIVARGDRVMIEGNSRSVERVVQVLNDLVTRLRKGDYVTDQYVNYAIAMVMENGQGPAESISTEALLTSALKKVIKPKTIGQTRYVEAVDKHDIVFSIGPAGTGKTYLAVAMA